ncbi:NAD(P)-dependent alcohol dehydrogenase [Stenotrophomonas sp. S39]|uniref:NAD(P)-dependent alcohol dehydrogenase n=1 Tax=Stenotrophomonas sp. S39 TaxID=2767451 RepID=UPI001F2EDB1F|nr:NAD(P)-dependent alcohol dehydrogenase [Stenotrophomonas sp. S39]
MRRNLQPDDVLIDIQYAGICHTDIHFMKGDFGPLGYQMVPGHEIVGCVAAVGSAVTKFKVGDLAGVGCMVDSCGICAKCKRGLEQYCDNGATYTYASKDRFSDDTQGGYSNRIVVREAFVIKIPPGANLAATAPLLCAGVTTFSPMQHWNIGKGKKVAIVGLGGLGHVALKLFKARGAEVTVFTTTAAKIPDAIKMGASEAVLWSDKEAFSRLKDQFNYLLSTVPYPFDVDPFMDLLDLDGVFTNVGVVRPLQAKLDLIGRRKSITGSAIGSISETQEVIDYCVSRNIGAEVEVIPIQQVNEAYIRVLNKDVRYRYVIDMSTLHA